MLVCPACHHELPASRAELPTDSSGLDQHQHQHQEQHQQQLPNTMGTSTATSPFCTTNKDGSGQQCHPVSPPAVAPTCHITPTCHLSRTCHVTPACRMKAPCHVTPYVCGCTLNHVSTPSAAAVQQDSTPNSIPTPPCTHNVNQTSSFSNTTSQKNNNDILNFKLFNLGSCPTSPSTPFNPCNAWPSSTSQMNTNESSINPNIFHQSSSKDQSSVHQCLSSQPCTFHSLNQHHHHGEQHHKSHLNINSSNLFHVTPESHTTCPNSSVCPNGRTNFGRQMSCPTTQTCVVELSCPCLQQQHDKQLQHDNIIHQHQQMFDCKNKAATNSDLLDKQRRSNSLGSHQIDQSFFQFQLPDQVTQHQTSELFLQSELPRNKGDNIVILNSSTGGGMIIERKEPSRSNSPELKMTLSLPMSNSVSTSGSISPITVNAVSFDREALMKTLASLPTVTTSSVLVSQSTATTSNGFSLSVSSKHASLAPQTFSTISFPPVSPTQSTSSSCSPSPVSFVQNDRLTCPDEIRAINKNSSFSFNINRSLSAGVSNISNNQFIANQIFPGIVEAVTSPPPQGRPAIVPACDWTSSDDARVLRKARSELEECGWYYGGLTWREAGAVLAGSSEGSYLVRDSWSGRCLYALSLQTSRGPTSVRIEYENGKFRLESETGARDGVPQRSSVVSLVQAYTQTSNPAHVWVDHSGQTVSAISVKKPLRKNPPSLQHLARLAYNSSPVKVDLIDSGIPNLIKAFLNSYPHSC